MMDATIVHEVVKWIVSDACQGTEALPPGCDDWLRQHLPAILIRSLATYRTFQAEHDFNHLRECEPMLDSKKEEPNRGELEASESTVTVFHSS